jgi:hypothetical protein
MPETAYVRVNQTSLTVPGGTTVAVAIMLAGEVGRQSVSGQPRGPLCGMGICFECRATVDGQANQRTCQLICRPGMEIDTRA